MRETAGAPCSSLSQPPHQTRKRLTPQPRPIPINPLPSRRFRLSEGSHRCQQMPARFLGPATHFLPGSLRGSSRGPRRCRFPFLACIDSMFYIVVRRLGLPHDKHQRQINQSPSQILRANISFGPAWASVEGKCDCVVYMHAGWASWHGQFVGAFLFPCLATPGWLPFHQVHACPSTLAHKRKEMGERLSPPDHS